MVIVIVGNKADLRSIQVVSTTEGKSLAKELGCFFEETSALTGDNVESTFMDMLECTWMNSQKFKSVGSSSLLLSSEAFSLNRSPTSTSRSVSVDYAIFSNMPD